MTRVLLGIGLMFLVIGQYGLWNKNGTQGRVSNGFQHMPYKTGKRLVGIGLCFGLLGLVSLALVGFP